jgi:MATE family multidrug resistance protein
MFLGLVIVVLTDRQFRRFHLFGRWWRPDWPRFVTLWRLGVPIGATMMLEITLFNAAVFIMGQFGTAAIAAHSIAIQIAAASFMVPMGLGQAATVRVGIAHGAGLRDDITRAGWTAFAMAMVFMAMMSFVLMTFPNVLIGAFIDITDPANAPVAEMAALFLMWAAIFQLADGAQVVGAGMLRGLQDTRVPMLYAAFGYWGCGMPLSLLFAFKFGYGGVGIWVGLASGLAVVAVLTIRRWMRRDRLGLVPTG